MALSRSGKVTLGVTTCLLLALATGLWPRQKPAQKIEAPSSNSPPVITTQNAFEPSKSAPEAMQHLAELRRDLAGKSTQDAVAAIQQLLASRKDAPTHQGFKIGTSGWLTEYPTVRVFLLDELGRLDPKAAAEYAKAVLASMDSPDEWAVALRNLARGDSTDAGRALLTAKMQQMLDYTPWQQNPTTGYLEAFDVAVHIGGTALLPTLSNLMRRQDSAAVSHAAFLALDRIPPNPDANSTPLRGALRGVNRRVLTEAGTTLGVLGAAPELMQGRELARADFFARADVRDPQQRQIIERYLLNPNINPAELRQFTGIFPNANFMVSQNLLTPTVTPDRTALELRDAESLRAVEQWIADPRFAKLQAQLQQVKTRLENFAKQGQN
jgi:hypothetical protein